jgi:MoaA/NifB/PqqE/SkfB family radical SAM enzyme
MSSAEKGFDSEKAEAVASWLRGVPKAPFSMELSPTAACNADCRFCGRGGSRAEGELEDEVWLDAVREAADMGTRRFLFRGGGEPALRKGLIAKLSPLIRQRGLLCTLLTNGTLIDEDTADALSGGGWEEVIVSLHGGDSSCHDSITGRPGSFQAVERSLELLNARKPRPRLSFHVVLTRRSFRELDRIIEFAARHSCSHVGFFPMHDPPSEEDVRDLRMSPEDDAAYLALVPRYKSLLDQHGISHHFELRYQGGGGGAAPVRAGIPCFFPWIHATITPDGMLSPCCYGEGSGAGPGLGQARFRGAWLGPGMQECRSKMLGGTMMPYCRKCPDWYAGDNERLRRLLVGVAP